MRLCPFVSAACISPSVFIRAEECHVLQTACTLGAKAPLLLDALQGSWRASWYSASGSSSTCTRSPRVCLARETGCRQSSSSGPLSLLSQVGPCCYRHGLAVTGMLRCQRHVLVFTSISWSSQGCHCLAGAGLARTHQVCTPYVHTLAYPGLPPLALDCSCRGPHPESGTQQGSISHIQAGVNRVCTLFQDWTQSISPLLLCWRLPVVQLPCCGQTLLGDSSSDCHPGRRGREKDQADTHLTLLCPTLDNAIHVYLNNRAGRLHGEL